MTDFVFTLAEARKQYACIEGHNRVVCYLTERESDDEIGEYIQHDAVVSILDVLESNGLSDALWALRYVKGRDRDIRLYAVWCARQVQQLMKDQRSINALDVAEKYANGKATEGELIAARSAAWAAARDAAWDAAWAAAWAAARSAACDFARDVEMEAVWDAARDAARAASIDAQKQMLIKMCHGQAPWQVSENGEPK